MEVEVLFPYEPQHEDELRLTVGSVITGVEPLESGWYKGHLGDITGVFPDNFVKVLSKEPKNGSTDTNVTPTNVQKRDNPSSPLAEMGGRRCRVVFSYAPQHDDELPLCVGQTIQILQEVEEGWWKGVLDGQVGMFPSNFVENMEEEDTETNQPEPSSLENINNKINVNGDGKEIKPKPVQGKGYGVKLTDLKKDQDGPKSNGLPKIGSSGTSAFQPVKQEPPKENGQTKDFRDLPHRLPPALEPKTERVTSKLDKTRINSADKERINSIEKDRITITIGEEKAKADQSVRREDRLPAPTSSAPPLSPPLLPPKPVREIARVMFPYNAEHEDELELQEGDIITVLCKELEDKGWWRGELNSRVGVFPDNFVELITVEETAKPPRPEKPAAVLGKKGSPASSTDTTPTGTLNKTDKEPPPPLPEKKIQAPPPPEKKPQASPSTTVDTHDGSCASKDTSEVTMPRPSKGPEGKEDLSLTLDTDGAPLRHVTHQRPKGPSRRPPSGIFKENDTSHQVNGHISSSELPRSPSVPAISPTPPKSSPRSETPNTAPWLQELHLKQKKRLSASIPEGEAQSLGPPTVSPKPSVLQHKKEEMAVVKPPRPSLPMTEAINVTVKARSTEPHPPTPDHESKTTHPIVPFARHKPLPQVPSSSLSEKKSIVQEQRASLTATEAKKPSSFKESQKGQSTSSSTEVPSSMKDKTDITYKELLPKIKGLEDRLEEQRKEHSHLIKMLMSDLDDERKKRACMEVEIERLKKLVNAFAQV